MSQETDILLRKLIDAVGTGAASTADGAAFTAGTTEGNISMGVYEATPTSVTDGDAAAIGIDSLRNTKVTMGTELAGEDLDKGVMGSLMKPVSSSTYTPLIYKDAGTVTKANVKASSGNIYALRVINTNASARYFQIHNKASAPAAADTAQLYFTIPGGTAAAPGILLLDTTFFAPSEYCDTGVGWAISTTATTFTDSATANEHMVNVRYV